jgi:chlorobactene glucosyltransferase
MIILEFLLGCALIGWLGLAVLSFWSMIGATLLRPGQAGEPLARAPKVSIIVPARNEESVVGAALESFLKLDYPDYEVILVDDASTDRTGEIADEWTRRPEAVGRLRVIHNHELPPGWRGKVHALHLAEQAASGEWLLATDADVVFHPAVLRLAMARAMKEDAALVSLFPELEFGEMSERIVLPGFVFLLATIFPLRLINNPKSSRALAAGAFILMRRTDFQALGGYEALRGTVVEDLRTAEMFKQGGRRIHATLTRGLYRTRMYQGWREIWEGLGRSAFEGTGFSLARSLAAVFVGNTLAVLPWAAAGALAIRDAGFGLVLRDDVPLLLALLTCVLAALVYLPFLIFLRISPFFVFTMPAACLFYSGVAIHSAWMSVMGHGVPWKGRRYRPPA